MLELQSSREQKLVDAHVAAVDDETDVGDLPRHSALENALPPRAFAAETLLCPTNWSLVLDGDSGRYVMLLTQS